MTRGECADLKSPYGSRDPLLQEIAKLRERNAALEDELRQLRFQISQRPQEAIALELSRRAPAAPRDKTVRLRFIIPIQPRIAALLEHIADNGEGYYREAVLKNISRTRATLTPNEHGKTPVSTLVSQARRALRPYGILKLPYSHKNGYYASMGDIAVIQGVMRPSVTGEKA